MCRKRLDEMNEMNNRRFLSLSLCRTGTVNYEQSKVLFRDLLTIFNKILLPTHDSSHVQFLLFHICSFHTVNFNQISSDVIHFHLFFCI